MSPLIETFANASARGWFAPSLGGSLAPNWFGGFSGTNVGNINHLDLNGSSMIVPAGQTLISVSTTGTIGWQKRWADGYYNYGAGHDSSYNVYAAGTTNLNRGFVGRFNSAGGLSWARQFYNTYNMNIQDMAIDKDGSGYSWIIGCYYNGSVFRGIVIQYNNDGSEGWQREMVGANPVMTGIGIGPNNESYIADYDAFASDGARLWKLNSSGGTTWINKYNNGGTSATSYGIASDRANDVVYMTTRNTLSGQVKSQLIKVNSNGTLAWQRSVADGSFGTYIEGSPQVDSSGNIYVAAFSVAATPRPAFIVKFDTNGNVLWQRKMVTATDNINPYCFYTNSDYFFIGGHSGGFNAFFSRLPSDGTGLGTYTVNGIVYTYSASSLTINDPGLSWGSVAITNNGGSLTRQTLSTTVVDGNATLYKSP